MPETLALLAALALVALIFAAPYILHRLERWATKRADR